MPIQLTRWQVKSHYCKVAADFEPKLSEISARFSRRSQPKRYTGENKIALPSPDLLARAEQRAETWRKELLDRIEKNFAEGRLAQIDEEIFQRYRACFKSDWLTRSVDCATFVAGFDNERRTGEPVESNIQSRLRLDDDVGKPIRWFQSSAASTR